MFANNYFIILEIIQNFKIIFGKFDKVAKFNTLLNNLKF